MKVAITYGEADTIKSALENMNNEDVAIDLVTLSDLFKVAEALSPCTKALKQKGTPAPEYKKYLEEAQALRHRKADFTDFHKLDDTYAEVLQAESLRRISFQRETELEFSVEIPDIKAGSIQILKPAGFGFKTVLKPILKNE